MNEVNGQRLKGLKTGWQLVKLADLVKINPKLPFEVKDDTMEVSFLPMKLVEEEKNQIHLTENKSYKDVKKGFTPMADGDVIFAKITPCMENGKIAVVHSLTNGIGFGSTEFNVLRCNGTLINKFLFYYLVQKQFRHEAESNMTGAVGQRRVPKRFLEESLIPLPTIEEQEEIVYKIEELFSELDKSIEDLKTAQQQLKVYRQSVLKWAFEGRLTNEEMIEGELPADWKMVKLDEVGRVTGGISKTPKRSSLPIKRPFLRVANVYFNQLDLSEIHEIGLSENELERVTLFRDDLLFVEGNGSLDQIGRVALWTDEIKDCVHQNHLIKVRLGKEILPKFTLYFFCSKKGRDIVKAKASSTSGLHTLSIGKIQSLELPIAPLKEQEQIILEIESRLSVADKVEETIVNSLEQAEALRQSILKKAFEGRLH